jgi:hypothetical protein
MSWYWTSLVKGDENLGVVIVQAETGCTALAFARALSYAPEATEIAGGELDFDPPVEYRGRLLVGDEAEAAKGVIEAMIAERAKKQ